MDHFQVSLILRQLHHQEVICPFKGKEFGTVTQRKRRCGWFDAAALKRSAMINGLSGLCITKLDVLDGIDSLKICIGYSLNGVNHELLP